MNKNMLRRLTWPREQSWTEVEASSGPPSVCRAFIKSCSPSSPEGSSSAMSGVNRCNISLTQSKLVSFLQPLAMADRSLVNSGNRSYNNFWKKSLYDIMILSKYLKTTIYNSYMISSMYIYSHEILRILPKPQNILFQSAYTLHSEYVLHKGHNSTNTGGNSTFYTLFRFTLCTGSACQVLLKSMYRKKNLYKVRTYVMCTGTIWRSK